MPKYKVTVELVLTIEADDENDACHKSLDRLQGNDDPEFKDIEAVLVPEAKRYMVVRTDSVERTDIYLYPHTKRIDSGELPWHSFWVILETIEPNERRAEFSRNYLGERLMSGSMGVAPFDSLEAAQAHVVEVCKP